MVTLPSTIINSLSARFPQGYKIESIRDYKHITKIIDPDGHEFFCKYDNFTKLEAILYQHIEEFSAHIKSDFSRVELNQEGLLLTKYLPHSTKNNFSELKSKILDFICDYHEFLDFLIAETEVAGILYAESPAEACQQWIEKSLTSWSESLLNLYPNELRNLDEVKNILFEIAGSNNICHGNIIPRYIRYGDNGVLYLTKLDLKTRPGGLLYDLVRGEDWRLVKGNTIEDVEAARDALKTILAGDYPCNNKRVCDELKKYDKKRRAALVYFRMIGIFGWDDLRMNTLDGDSEDLRNFKRKSMMDLLQQCCTILS